MRIAYPPLKLRTFFLKSSSLTAFGEMIIPSPHCKIWICRIITSETLFTVITMLPNGNSLHRDQIFNMDLYKLTKF